MIAYLDKYDTTVEVPDDISDKDLQDVNQNFHSYVDTTPKVSEPTKPVQNEPTTPSPEPAQKWQPNFYQAALSQTLAPLKAIGEATQGPQAEAFAGKVLEGLSFGATKSITPEFLSQEYKDHPAFANAGTITGGVGSLMEAGGALRIAGLAAPAAAAGSAAVEAGFSAGERFIPRAIMTGATFGTRTFIAETVKHFEEGGVNLEQFGKDVLKDTAFGGIFGAIGGLDSAVSSISSAGALGFISSKMSGSDNREASLNAAIWAAFETVGSVGKSESLRMEALGHLKDSIGEYIGGRNPDIQDKDASRMASAFVDHAITKAGFENAEDIAKSGPENLLEGIEKVNQMVRTARIPAEPEAQTPLLPKLPAPIEPETAVTAQEPMPKPLTPLERAIDTVKGIMGIKPEQPKPPTVMGDTYEEKIQSLKDQGHDVSKMPIEAFPEDMKDIYHFEQGKQLKADVSKAISEISDRLTTHGISDDEQNAILSHYGLDKIGQFGQAVVPTEAFRLPIEDQYKQAYSVLAAERGIPHGESLSDNRWTEWQEILKTGIKPPTEDLKGEYSQLPLSRKNTSGRGIDEIAQEAREKGLLGENEDPWVKIRSLRPPNAKPEKFDSRTMDDAKKSVDLINGYFSPKSQEIKDFVAQHGEASDHDIAQMAYDRGIIDSPNPDLLKVEIQKANQEKIIARQKSALSSETGSIMIPPDLVDAVEHLQKSSEEISNIVAPSKAAPLATQITREQLGKMARAYDMAEASLKDSHDVLEKRSKEENLNFIDNLERGNPQRSENLQVIADKLRELLDDKRKEIQDLGTGKLDNFIENYFPHIWDQGEKEVGQAVQKASKRPFEGQKSFLKKRSIEFTKEGVQAGLTPVSYNPVNLALLKMREMDKYIMAHRTLNELKDEGLAKFVKVDGDIPEGWQKIDDRISTVMFKSDAGLTISGHIYAQPDTARIINNYLSPGLQKSAIYQAYRYAGNIINQFQLSLSAFHLGFTTVDSIVSKFALALNELASGNLLKAATNVMATPFSPITTLIKGNELLKAWRGQGQNASDNVIAEAMASGGGRARMDQFYATKASDQMKHYFETGRVFKGIYSIPFSLLDISSKPTLEYIVPRMKLGAFSDIMKMEMQNNPNMTHEEIRELSQRAWDSIDNRLGQMVYDNLFWNRTFKDLLMGSVRSVGWNLGTLRELAGGAVDYADAIKDTVMGKKTEFTYRMAYLAALPVIVGTLGAIMQYIRTGKGPQEAKDYFFPRTGGVDEHGDPHRIALPSYMKDIYHYSQSPVTIVLNKLNPLLAMMAQMFENKDFYGTKIRNEDDPLVKQAMAEVAYIAKQAIPFSIRNMQKNQQAGNKSLFDTVGPWVGITPAPYDIDQTKAEKLAHEISMSHQEIGGRTEEQMERSRLISDLTRQYKTGDPKATENLYKAYEMGAISHRQMEQVIVHSSLTPLQRSVKNMTLEETERVYAKANDEEKSQIESMLNRKRVAREREFVNQ